MKLGDLIELITYYTGIKWIWKNYIQIVSVKKDKNN